VSKRSKYPRIHSKRKYQEPHPQAYCQPCKKIGQTEPAIFSVRVEFTYMRGEDSFTRVCGTHYTELQDLCHPQKRLMRWPAHFQGSDIWKD